MPPSDDRDTPMGSRRLPVLIDVVVVAAAVGFVLLQLQPRLLFTDTMPAGGDMGAHVWGPAYLRDHVLPHFRLTGWSPDWYNGFPAFHFYMVVPSLLIVVVNNGWQGIAGLIPLGVAVLAAYGAWRFRSRWLVRSLLLVVAVVVALLGLGVPYGIAFKVVSVLGVLALPVAAYVFGRLVGLPFPAPSLLAVASLGFLFNREPLTANTGTIIGGNIASTLAGEFAFSLSLVFLLLYLGVLYRGLRTGRYRALAAVFLGLTAVCHLIPAIYAAVATPIIVALTLERPLGAAIASRLRWLATALPIGVLLAGFWLLPFWWRRDYLNDMGWEKLPSPGSGQDVWDFLAPRPLYAIIALAVVGAMLSIVFFVRGGIFLALTAVVFSVLFVVWPQGRMWNARLLPFYLLCVFLLAGLAVAELARTMTVLLARDPNRPPSWVRAVAPPVGLALALLLVGLPLGVLPDSTREGDRWHWGPFSAKANVVVDWAKWNYNGYERKPARADGTGGYPEYYRLITTMRRVGTDNGCGRAMWEYESDRLNSYGTPMAPMLLPHWTDGCIKSQEGLYFESAATTPYHFITQGELSDKCSCSQRFDTQYEINPSPYQGFNIERGIEHLQMLGVRYYLAFSDNAVRAASRHQDLTEIAVSDPWHVYEVRGSPVVAPLANEPAVFDDVEPHKGWVRTAVAFFTNPRAWNVSVAADGPADWPRFEPGRRAPVRPVDGPRVKVSNTRMDDDRISFDVSRPGAPILVRASYFPNWRASGADGPYRVTPNLMVVVPTSRHVELHYGWTPVDGAGYGATGLGLLGVLLLARRPPVRVSRRTPAPSPEGEASAVEGEDESQAVPVPAS